MGVVRSIGNVDIILRARATHNHATAAEHSPTGPLSKNVRHGAKSGRSGQRLGESGNCHEPSFAFFATGAQSLGNHMGIFIETIQCQPDCKGRGRLYRCK